MPTGQEISNSKGASASGPRPMSSALATVLAIASNALENESLTSAALPSGARAALEARGRELDGALTSPRPDKVRSIVAGLGTMPARSEDDPTKARFIVDQFIAICSDVPEWALTRAAWAFLRNEAGTGFRPAAGELRAFAMRRVDELRIERHKLDRVLRVRLAPPEKPASPERRKALANMLRNAAQEFGLRDIEGERSRGVKVADIGPREPETRAQAAQKVAQGFSHLRGPLTVSAELQASLDERFELSARKAEAS